MLLRSYPIICMQVLTVKQLGITFMLAHFASLFKYLCKNCLAEGH